MARSGDKKQKQRPIHEVHPKNTSRVMRKVLGAKCDPKSHNICQATVLSSLLKFVYASNEFDINCLYTNLSGNTVVEQHTFKFSSVPLDVSFGLVLCFAKGKAQNGILIVVVNQKKSRAGLPFPFCDTTKKFKTKIWPNSQLSVPLAGHCTILAYQAQYFSRPTHFVLQHNRIAVAAHIFTH